MPSTRQLGPNSRVRPESLPPSGIPLDSARLYASRTSAQSTLASCCMVGAATTLLLLGCIVANQSRMPASTKLLPTPLPVLTQVTGYLTSDSQISRCRLQ